MRQGIRIAYIVLFVAAITMLKAESLSAEYLPVSGRTLVDPQFQYANSRLWEYLRMGLNYLESPKPLLPPEDVPPTYVHPDSRGFGAYGFSPEAYQDVQRLYPFFQNYGWQYILDHPRLYELANQAFADYLLKGLQGHIPFGATPEKIFDVLHQAWNLGLSGFKNGGRVVSSRTRRAEEFIKDSLVGI